MHLSTKNERKHVRAKSRKAISSMSSSRLLCPLPAFSLAHHLIPHFAGFLNVVLDARLQMFTYMYARIVVWDPQVRKKVVFFFFFLRLGDIAMPALSL